MAESEVTATSNLEEMPGDGRNILIAVDASDNAQFAFDYFLENIYRPTDTLIVVHCPETPSLPTFSFKSPMTPPVAEWKGILDEMNTKTRKLEENYEGTCIEKKLKYRMRGEASKSPGEGIIRIAEEEKCCLIVIGTRGLGTIRRALLGSVSDYVTKHSVAVGIPTLVVPGKSK